MEQALNLIVMGGSWGGLQASLSVLAGLPDTYPLPIILVLHRLKNAESDLQGLLSRKLRLPVQEVEEKESIRGGHVYLAPSNYHVLIEKNRTFSLDVSEQENYSRPSIDVTFSSAAEVYRAHTAGILLSGASEDGSSGLRDIRNSGGLALVQDPSEAEAATMPAAGIRRTPDCRIYPLKKIQEFLLSQL